MIPELVKINRYNKEQLQNVEEYYDEIFGKDFNEERLFYLLGWCSIKLERDFEYDEDGNETNCKWIVQCGEWSDHFDYYYVSNNRLDAMKGVAVLWYLCCNTIEGVVTGLESISLEDQKEEIKRLQRDMQDMIRITKEKVLYG